MFNLVKKAALKFLLPIILIVAVIAVLMGAFSAPISVVLDMFGGIITFFFGDGSNPDEKVEVVIEEYINDETERGINEFYDKINETVNNNLIENGGNYHVVRIYFGVDNEQIAINGLIDKISSAGELNNIIEPVFNTLVFQRYERRVSEKHAKELIDEIYGKLFTTKTENKPIEYCGAVHDCDSRHASADCPNYESGYHDSYICSTCDSYAYSCDGHSSGHSFPGCYTLNCITAHTHTNNCYTPTCTDSHTYYHTTDEQLTMEENKQLVCNGYIYCDGHKVLGIYIEQGDLNKLLDEYFINPIMELEVLENKTDNQEQELRTLKTNYNLCLDYINVVNSRIESG